MNNHLHLSLLIGAGALTLALGACQRTEGPAERAGKQVDQSAERVSKQTDKTVDKVKNKIDDAKK